jgi:hypothetical protein
MDLEKTNMLNETGASLFLGVAKQTMANWRSQRRGPVYHKLSRRVVYRLSDLEDFIQSCRIEPQGNINE